MNPEIVTFRITARCNYNCACCFGPKGIPDLPLAIIKKIIKRLSLLGFKSIVLTGGEPLMREDIGKIIEELRKNNLKINLDTNGDYFFKHKETITKNIDVLGLPLDDLKRGFRGKAHLDNLKKILEYYKNNKKNQVIRISTVVTQENYKELENIKNFLENYTIDILKISEFIPQNMAISNKNKLEILNNEFEEATRNLKSDDFRITISKRQSRSAAYFFIDVDGSVFMPIDDLNICKEKKIGNVFDEDILKKWQKEVIINNYLENIDKTFNK